MTRDVGLPSSAHAMKRQVPLTVEQRIPRDVPVSASRSRLPDSAEAMRPDLPRAGGILTSAQMQGVRE